MDVKNIKRFLSKEVVVVFWDVRDKEIQEIKGTMESINENKPESITISGRNRVRTIYISDLRDVYIVIQDDNEDDDEEESEEEGETLAVNLPSMDETEKKLN